MYNVTLRCVHEATVVCMHVSHVCADAGVGARAQACACGRVAVLIQHATCMCHVVAASLASLHSSTLSHK